MGTEVIFVFVTCGIVFLLIMIGSWCRRQKDINRQPTGVSRVHETVINGQRTFRIATVSRHDGLLSLDVYEIRLPRANDPTSAATITLLPSSTPRRANIRAGGQPPPPFNMAVNMPSPTDIPTLYAGNYDEARVPPPRYDEVVPISTISGHKVPEQESSNAPPSIMHPRI